MSDLLSIGLSGVTAYRTALATVADNVANAETPGYARREVRLREGMNVGSESPIYREDLTFAGVEAASVGRAWDAYRAADSRYAASAAGRTDVRAQWLGTIETELEDGPAGVGSLMSTFFNAGESLAATPSDRIGRVGMLMALENTAATIRSTASGLARVSEGIAQAARIDVDGLNADLAALADVNSSLRQTAPGGPTYASAEDERDRLIDSISKRIDVSASIGKQGVATITLGRVAGVTLLDPADRAVVNLVTAADGRISLQMFSNGTATPLPASAGRLAGLVDVAASTADKRNELDGIAEQFVTDVNAWSAQGRRPDGTAGGPLLEALAGAASLRALTTDPAAIAAASSDGTENGNLLALPALRGSEGVEARWAALVTAQALALNAARSEASAASSRRDGSFAARDDVSGVDLDREAAELIRYQRAYDGSAKIIQIARETMQSILDLF
jgi:flagellar hook-associated protein 1 FlgK